jgi:hypothetical protein
LHLERLLAGALPPPLDGGLALLVVFVYGAFSALKKTAIYEATAQSAH